MPRRVVRKILANFCGRELELGLNTLQNLVRRLSVFQIELLDDVSPVIPTMDYAAGAKDILKTLALVKPSG